MKPLVGISESLWPVFLAARDRALQSKIAQESTPSTLWAHLVCVVMMRDDLSMKDFTVSMCHAVLSQYPDFLNANRLFIDCE